MQGLTRSVHGRLRIRLFAKISIVLRCRLHAGSRRLEAALNGCPRSRRGLPRKPSGSGSLECIAHMSPAKSRFMPWLLQHFMPRRPRAAWVDLRRTRYPAAVGDGRIGVTAARAVHATGRGLSHRTIGSPGRALPRYGSRLGPGAARGPRVGLGGCTNMRPSPVEVQR